MTHEVVLVDAGTKTIRNPRNGRFFKAPMRQPVYTCRKHGGKRVTHEWNGKYASGEKCVDCGTPLKLSREARYYA